MRSCAAGFRQLTCAYARPVPINIWVESLLWQAVLLYILLPSILYLGNDGKVPNCLKTVLNVNFISVACWTSPQRFIIIPNNISQPKTYTG